MLRNVLLICILFVQSCAVYMAADGEKSPNIAHFDKGMSRFQVESVVGAPVSYKKVKDKKIAVYEFEIGNEPDSNRAITWLVADIFLLFIPELVGTPYELSQGEDKRIRVTYDENDNVIDLKI